jgi:hypothetical protein
MFQLAAFSRATEVFAVDTVLARVVLHFANYSDYETLDTSMEREGFRRIVQAKMGSATICLHEPPCTT